MKDVQSATRKKTRQAREALEQRRFRRARTLYSQVCKLNPRDIESWIALAMVSGELGEFQEAERCCRRALQLNPGLGRAHYVLGKALKALGDAPRAVAHFQQALALEGGSAELHNDLGNALQAAGRPQDALASYNQALCLRPGYVRALFNLGHVRQILGQPDEALACYRRALELEPVNPRIHYMLAVVLSVAGCLDEALDHYCEVLNLEPDNPDAVAGIAAVYEKRGERQAALERLRPYLAATPDPSIAIAYADLALHLRQHQEAAALVERVLNREPPPAKGHACGLHFRLADLYDALGRYEEAFRQYQAGNALRGAVFDGARHVEAVDALIEAYTADGLARAPRASIASARPVFIVGMPRSGTTLVEQVLASHPDVHGAGELYEIERLVCRLPMLPDKLIPEPDRVKALTVAELDTLAQAYLDRLDEVGRQAPRVTDKMPYNFLHLGLLNMLFPGARVIHCRRDPLDTCLSCYFQNFIYGNSHTFDLEHVGLYYRQYRRLMDHWSRVVDLPLLEVRYEDMVADPEAVSRRLVDFCGLPWDETCLRFYEHSRVANTASYDQVRRPVYSSSVGRWRRYEAFIGPLRDALE